MGLMETVNAFNFLNSKLDLKFHNHSINIQAPSWLYHVIVQIYNPKSFTNLRTNFFTSRENLEFSVFFNFFLTFNMLG